MSKTILDRLQRLARRWHGLKPVALATALILFLASAAIIMLVPGPSGDSVLLPMLLGCVWALSGFLFIYLFEAVPPPPDRDIGLLARFQRRLVRGLYWLLSLAFFVLGALVLMMSFRMLREWGGALLI